jgi:hypothetical protein
VSEKLRELTVEQVRKILYEEQRPAYTDSPDYAKRVTDRLNSLLASSETPMSETSASAPQYRGRNGVDWDAELEYIKELDAKEAPALPPRDEQLRAAAELTVQHFRRNQASGNFQGDDEHECWNALERALAHSQQQKGAVEK